MGRREEGRDCRDGDTTHRDHDESTKSWTHTSHSTHQISDPRCDLRGVLPHRTQTPVPVPPAVTQKS